MRLDSLSQLDIIDQGCLLECLVRQVNIEELFAVCRLIHSQV